MVDWIEKPIGDLFNFKNGLNKGKEYFGRGTPIINYMDVYKNDGVYSYELCGRVELSAQEIKRFEIRKGDVFFTRTSETPEEVGIACVLLDDVVDGVFSGFVLRGRPITDELNIEYCKYCFQTVHVRDEIVNNCTYTTRALTNGMQLSKISIPVPPPPEQRAITAVLSNVDGYIAALELLIAKKRNIKKGAMQELLTGKQRLPGFDGEWVEKTLIELVPNLRMGQSPDSNFYNTKAHGLPLIQGNADIENRKTIVRSYTSQITKYAYAGDIILTVRAPVGNVAKATFDCCLGRGVCGFFYPNEYLYQWLVHFEPFWDSLSTGSTFDSIPGDKLKEVIVGLPENENEQVAIATILSDMDSEIDALTARLNKVRNIKQGMMKELLTGRIRLVNEEPETVPKVTPKAKVIKLPKREMKTATAQTDGHNQQFDDAVMIAGIVNALYSDKYPLGRKRVQKCLYLLRRHQDECTAAFKKKAAGPYADEVRYKGGEPIAQNVKYITTTTTKGKGTTFACGCNIDQALRYIENWGKQSDIQWLTDKLKYKKVDELELLATVDMAICDLEETGIPVSVAAIKHLIATNEEWKAKLKKQTFSDSNIAKAIKELQTLL